MLTCFKRQWLGRIANAMVIAYALCVIVPSVAAAFADDRTFTGHCLTAAVDGAPHLHVHGEAAHKGVAPGAPTKDSKGFHDSYLSSCCDLSCDVAGQNDFATRIDPLIGTFVVAAAFALPLSGRKARPPHRPPSVTLSSI